MFPFFVHTQAVASATWTIIHGLGATSLVVEVWNDLDQLIFADEIEKTNPTTMTITFTTPVAGRAVIVNSIGGNSHTHTQVVAATAWNVPHGLGSLDLIMSVYDDGAPARIIIPDEIEQVDANNALVTFTTAVAGSVSTINATGLQAFTHTQGIAANPWAVTHGLGSTNLLVSLWDNGATRNRFYPDELDATTTASQVDWTNAVDGFAVYYTTFDNAPGVPGAASGVIVNSVKSLRAMPGTMAR